MILQEVLPPAERLAWNSWSARDSYLLPFCLNADLLSRPRCQSLDLSKGSRSWWRARSSFCQDGASLLTKTMLIASFWAAWFYPIIGLWFWAKQWSRDPNCFVSSLSWFGASTCSTGHPQPPTVSYMYVLCMPMISLSHIWLYVWLYDKLCVHRSSPPCHTFGVQPMRLGVPAIGSPNSSAVGSGAERASNWRAGGLVGRCDEAWDEAHGFWHQLGTKAREGAHRPQKMPSVFCMNH